MFKIAIGHAQCVNTKRVTDMALIQIEAQLKNIPPNAGIVFASTDFDHSLMLSMIKKKYPEMDLIGCTTAGEFSSLMGTEDDSVLIIVFASDCVEITSGLGEQVSINPEKAVIDAITQAKKGLSKDEVFCITFPYGNVDIHAPFMNNLNEKCPILGGCAAEDGLNNTNIKQFYNDRVIVDAFPLMIFAGPVTYDFVISRSWHPIGQSAEITEVIGSKVKKIGHLKALDFFRHYLGDELFPATESGFVIVKDNKTNNETDNFVVRTPVAYNTNDRSVSFASKMSEGSTIQLSETTSSDILDDVNSDLQKLMTSSRIKNPMLALCFSCAVRKTILGTKITEELNIIKRHMPENLPIVGFFSHGEYAPIKKGTLSKFHNTTLVTLMIGVEDEAMPEKVDLSSLKQAYHQMNNICSREDILQLIQKKHQRQKEFMDRLEKNKDQKLSLLRKINQEIELAKLEILKKEEKLQIALTEVKKSNKKLMDSIQYAKLIQRSLLPDKHEMQQHFPNSFLLWMPRDVVGGDIFLAGFFDDGSILCVIDCTGHGVPGAFMTMIASSGIRQLIHDENYRNPAVILEKMNYIIKSTLQKDKEIETSDDGLDAAICYIPRNQKRLIYAGARLPIYYVENGRTKFIKGDRQSIGYKKSDIAFEFKNHEIAIESTTCFYMATDGYIDQLGSEKKHPFGRSRFLQSLERFNHHSLAEQKILLKKSFMDFMGNQMRRDDITVLGFQCSSRD